MTAMQVIITITFFWNSHIVSLSTDTSDISHSSVPIKRRYQSTIQHSFRYISSIGGNFNLVLTL